MATLIIMVASAALILFLYLLRLRIDHMGNDEGLARSDTGLFILKVAAFEYDESGPLLYLNGAYRNESHEPFSIAQVVAEAASGSDVVTFDPFDPTGGGVAAEVRGNILLTLSAPVRLRPAEGGLFQIPLRIVGRDEEMAERLDDFGKAAKLALYENDKRWKSYSLDGETLQKIDDDFLSDPWVRDNVIALERQLFWAEGVVAVKLDFYDHDDAIIERMNIAISLSADDIARLRSNVTLMALNRLRAMYDLDPLPFDTVVIDGSPSLH